MQDKSPMTHLENICEIIMGQSPKGETYNTIDNGTPLLNGPTEFGEHHPKPVLYTTSPTKLCKKGDLLFCVRGSTTGRMNWADAEYCIGRGVGAFRAKSDEIDTRFIYYTLLCELPRLLSRCAGSVFPNLSRSDFETFDVVWPDRNIRSAIAHILGTLDDKIELNRKMNETLETMARAVFKSWFVDFDPIPGLGPHKEWQDSALGRIPKGWFVVPLPKGIEVNPSRALRKGEVAPYLDMANMPTRSARAMEVYDREFGSGMRFIDGDTLVARITPCLENGKTCFVDFLGSGKVGWGSTEYIVLRPKPPMPPEFAYFLSRTEDFRSFAISNMTGSSGRQRVPADSFNHFLIVLPAAEIAGRFGQFAHATMDKMKANDEQSRTLTAIRDALLPKLLSGEIMLKDAERLMHTAATPEVKHV